MVDNVIIEATGVAVVSLRQNGFKQSTAIAAAMEKAVLDAADKGITDPTEIKKLMTEARGCVLDG